MKYTKGEAIHGVNAINSALFEGKKLIGLNNLIYYLDGGLKAQSFSTGEFVPANGTNFTDPMYLAIPVEEEPGVKEIHVDVVIPPGEVKTMITALNWLSGLLSEAIKP